MEPSGEECHTTKPKQRKHWRHETFEADEANVSSLLQVSRESLWSRLQLDTFSEKIPPPFLQVLVFLFSSYFKSGICASLESQMLKITMPSYNGKSILLSRFGRNLNGRSCSCQRMTLVLMRDNSVVVRFSTESRMFRSLCCNFNSLFLSLKAKKLYLTVQFMNKH